MFLREIQGGEYIAPFSTDILPKTNIAPEILRLGNYFLCGKPLIIFRWLISRRASFFAIGFVFRFLMVAILNMATGQWTMS